MPVALEHNSCVLTELSIAGRKWGVTRPVNSSGPLELPQPGTLH